MMYFIASKLLSFIINPMVWLLFCLAWAWKTKSAKRKQNLLLFSILAILFFGNTVVFNFVESYWEKDTAITMAQLKTHKTIIVLGGYNYWNPLSQAQDLNEAGDRLTFVLPLISDSNKSILFSGGSGMMGTVYKTEGEITESYLNQFDSIKSHIFYEIKSKNTKENISLSKHIVDSLHLKDIVVISSNQHIPRIRKIIKSQHLDWQAYGVESEIIHELQPNDYLFPKAGNLQKWNKLLHELAGYVVN